MTRTSNALLACLMLAAALLSTAPAGAQLQPSSDVLLPYFEVDLQKASAANTLLEIGNALDKPVEIEITVFTNWGIQIMKTNLTLAGHQVRSFNLRTWLAGELPGKRLTGADMNHFKAALTGQRSPKDNLFYASQIGPNLAVGSVRIKTLGKPQPDALWGTYFLLDGDQGSGEGDTLINLDPGTGCIGGCQRHALRFLTAGTFDGGTQVVVWSNVAGKPSSAAKPADYVQADTLAYDDAGQPLGGNRLRLLPVQVVSVADLGLRQPSGSIDLQTETTSVVAVHYSSKNRFGVSLMSYCLPFIVSDPGLHIEKLTNGQDADTAPGPSIPVGQPVLWEYIVENTGDAVLSNVQVSDDQGVSVSCPKVEIAPGERMTCTGRGTAEACQYRNIGTATASTPTGDTISAEDPSHYFGDQNAALDIELLVNGDDADTPMGPQVDVGSRINWTYIVTNTGDVALSNVKVSDDQKAAVSCPKTGLRPGESMTCTASGTAAKGQIQNVGSVTGESSCSEVRDEDPGHYFGREPEPPGISIQKLTNSNYCKAAPGGDLPVGSPVRWDYIVTNNGKVRLDNVQVTDDKEGAVSCPKSTLQPGETMNCSKTGVVQACQYSNIGTVTAKSPAGEATSASDQSWYFGQTSPALRIETYTNGQDANEGTGPEIRAGHPVEWTYTVTNTGNVALRDVRVTDDRVGGVSCPKAGLQPGESMTCSASGVASAGQYKNVGTATGTADTPCGGSASASDPSHYLGTKTNEPPQCNARPSVSELWPPNHKMVNIDILGVTDPNGDPVTVKIDGITQDEPVNDKGDGNTETDGAGVGTSRAQVRAERSGLHDGRVYAIRFTARDNQGASCSGTVFVGVPHDQRGTPPVDSGQKYDSTVP